MGKRHSLIKVLAGPNKGKIAKLIHIEKEGLYGEDIAEVEYADWTRETIPMANVEYVRFITREKR